MADFLGNGIFEKYKLDYLMQNLILNRWATNLFEAEQSVSFSILLELVKFFVDSINRVHLTRPKTSLELFKTGFNAKFFHFSNFFLNRGVFTTHSNIKDEAFCEMAIFLKSSTILGFGLGFECAST